MRTEKIYVKEWNKHLDDHALMVKKRRNGQIIIICEKCEGEMEDQKHVDDTDNILKRQVICCNCSCVDYRLE